MPVCYSMGIFYSVAFLLYRVSPFLLSLCGLDPFQFIVVLLLSISPWHGAWIIALFTFLVLFSLSLSSLWRWTSQSHAFLYLYFKVFFFLFWGQTWLCLGLLSDSAQGLIMCHSVNKLFMPFNPFRMFLRVLKINKRNYKGNRFCWSVYLKQLLEGLGK